MVDTVAGEPRFRFRLRNVCHEKLRVTSTNLICRAHRAPLVDGKDRVHLVQYRNDLGLHLARFSRYEP